MATPFSGMSDTTSEFAPTTEPEPTWTRPLIVTFGPTHTRSPRTGASSLLCVTVPIVTSWEMLQFAPIVAQGLIQIPP